MILVEEPNWEALCTDAAAFKTQIGLIKPILEEYLFWFGVKQQQVKSRLEAMRKSSVGLTNSCLEKNIDLKKAKQEILEADQTIKFIFSYLQFPNE